MECDFCKKESDYFTVNGEAICEDCISKKGYCVCTQCGKYSKFVTNDLCTNCQCDESDD